MKMILNKADVTKLLEVLNKFDVDYFELLKHDTSGIGYTLDIEFPMEIKGELVSVKASVVGTNEW